MPLFGSHLSIAGGYFKAVDAAAALGLHTVQLFTKNNNQWAGKPLTDEDVRLFRDALARTGIQRPCAHDSYLINLASPDDVLWQKSLDALVHELERAEALGLEGVVMHPGSYVKSSEEEGLQKIVAGLDEAHRRTKGFRCQYWLETTAGQGTNLGNRFEHLAFILKQVQEPERLGICVDTCHIFAAGYPLQSPDEYAATMDEFDRTIGIDRIRAWHINDSKKPLGSRVDRHEHIGEGCLGLEPFRHLVNDPRFAQTPMYLETEKGERDGVNLDAMNLATLNSLISPSTGRTAKKQKQA
ncbi:deoxyribonuclease IV [Schlesneria sp.]|uniref:deoxyribonuclease IV n=1 Tax=Schlesneria sp. TaxID=2762018 RepID=UPI002EE2ADC9